MNNILQDADQIIHGARNEAYGSPLENHGLTAQYWTVYLNAVGVTEGTVTAIDVCFMNILQKISRSQGKVDLQRDTLVDIAGYAGNIEMIMDEIKKQ